MNVPHEFLQLCKLFYQYSHEGHDTFASWAAAVLRGRNKDQKRVIKAFLDELLGGGHSDAELQRAWESANPDYYFDDPGLRGLLTDIRDLIDREEREQI